MSELLLCPRRAALLEAAQIAALAKGLSEAQTRFLRRGYVTSRRGYWPMFHGLRAKGIIHHHEEALTGLGLALRAHLEGQEK